MRRAPCVDAQRASPALLGQQSRQIYSLKVGIGCVEASMTMRITAVTTSVPGPQKPRLLGFVRALTAAGHDVSVVATADLSLGGGAKADEQGRALMKQMGVPVTQVPFTPAPLHIVRSTISVALRRRSSETALYDSQRLAEQFAVAVEATRPDVVHVDRVRAVPLIRALAVPFVVDLTDPRLADISALPSCQGAGPGAGRAGGDPQSVAGPRAGRARRDDRSDRHSGARRLGDRTSFARRRWRQRETSVGRSQPGLCRRTQRATRAAAAQAAGDTGCPETSPTPRMCSGSTCSQKGSSRA